VRVLAVGELVVISNGTYDDYESVALARVLRPLSKEQLVQAYPRDQGMSEVEIVGWLVEQGYVEIVEAAELHLLSFGAWSDDEVNDSASIMRCSACGKWCTALDRDAPNAGLCWRCSIDRDAKARGAK